MRLTRHTDVARSAWLAFPPLVRWLLLVAGKTPWTLTTGDVRAIREALS